MNKKLFSDLVESMTQMNEIARGQRAPSRQFNVDAPSIQRVALGSHAFKISGCTMDSALRRRAPKRIQSNKKWQQPGLPHPGVQPRSAGE